MARNLSHNFKRMVAGLCALLLMAGTIPAGTDFGGVFGGSGIVASAQTASTTYNVTANTGLSYTGEAQDLVTTTGSGGTIKYALSNGATVYKQGEANTRKKIKKPVVGDAFCPQNGDYSGYVLPTKYSKFVYGGETYNAYNDGIGITKWGGVCHITKIGLNDVNLPEEYDGVKITAIDEVNGIITFEGIKSSEYDPLAGLVWGTTAPKGTGAGDYYVCWKVEGNDEYNGKDPAMVTTTIAKVDFTLTGAETGYTGEALDLITGDVPAGTLFTMTEPKEDADYDEEKEKTTEWVKMIENMMYGQTPLDHDEQLFYDRASEALYYYGAAIDCLKDNYEDDADYCIDHAKRAAADMATAAETASYNITPSDDDVKEAIAYINTYIKDTTLAATKERFDPAVPTVWSDEIPKEIAIGEYTVYYKGDGVNYSDEIKSVTAEIKEQQLETRESAITDCSKYDDVGRITFSYSNTYTGTKNVSYGVLIYREGKLNADMTVDALPSGALNTSLTSAAGSFRTKDKGTGVYVRTYMLIDGEYVYGEQVFVKHEDMMNAEALENATSAITNFKMYDDVGRITFSYNNTYTGTKNATYGVLIYREGELNTDMTVDALPSGALNTSLTSAAGTFRTKDKGTGVYARTYMLIDGEYVYGEQVFVKHEDLMNAEAFKNAVSAITKCKKYDNAGRITFSYNNTYKGTKNVSYGVLIYREGKLNKDMTVDALPSGALNTPLTSAAGTFRTKDKGTGVYVRTYMVIDGEYFYGDQVLVKHSEL